MIINLELLDEESATETIEIVAEIAKANGVDWALVGGLAMALYGSDRTTKNIDIIADKLLPLEKVGELRQGGERYLIKTNKKEILFPKNIIYCRKIIIHLEIHKKSRELLI